MDRFITSHTGEAFPMPMRWKTLSRFFLGKTDLFFPLEEARISILPEIF
jgi:hypothetical protein